MAVVKVGAVPAMEADAFADVHLGQMQSESIDCLLVYGVGQGRFVDGYPVDDPGEDLERVTFTLTNDEGTADWRMRYVDAALHEGSGREFEVEGNAIIEVVLTGIAPPDTTIDFDATGIAPPDTTIDFDATGIAPPDTTIDFDASLGGDAVVDGVDGSWFEGRHQLLPGTTGRHDVGAVHLDAPYRVYLDVFAD